MCIRDRRWSPLVEMVTVINETIPLGRSLPDVLSCIRRLRRARYTCALDLQGRYRSAVLSWLSCAPRRIGRDRQATREPGATIFYTCLLYTSGFWRSDENFPRVDLILYSSDLPSYKEPVRLGLRENGRYAASPLAGVKVTSWLNNVWSLYEAQQAGCDEVVMLNERGEVAECTAANIFSVRGGRVCTCLLYTSRCV